MGEYDKSSKWLIERHGDAILRLAGVQDVLAWRALPAELVQPRQLPDGVLEVEFPDRTELFVVEIATYPEQRLVEQVLADSALVYLNRRVLPEVLTVLLRPRGRRGIAAAATVRSPRGWTRWDLRWREVALWTVPAADLFALEDPGVAPWIPLSKFAGPPGPRLEQCRRLIEARSPERERRDLLAVTQIFAGLRYHDPGLLAILGGRQAMIESPVLREFVAEQIHRVISRILSARFGQIPHELVEDLEKIEDPRRLEDLSELAATCPSLQAFRSELAAP